MSNGKLHMQIVSPTGTLFEGEADSVSLPGTMGPFTVLPRHAPIISALDKGVVVYSDDAGNRHEIAVSGGFAEVKDNVVTVAVEIAGETTAVKK